ncbi:hypothetical protein DEU56DRAFT_910589 [Suillus clintonianus]|uniref:uncharacterized protein n=1 Tax=Suillus clintonianus TaxID=1904413 RepID=UPI001B8732B7|nr:uncharacterized protein DEU56DRAFT_910589 [Suillus clintonianus]KAG2144235.1 hypothetical protein DEU56DRAFT_910589 [Suillus clintonianus]
MSAPSKYARVEQHAANKPPFLTAGEISPEVFRAWEMGCRQFFMHKDIPDDQMVKKVAWGMQEPIIQDWYLNDQDRLNALSFTDYIKEVRSYWLPADWADAVRQKMLSSTQGSKPFNEWAVEVQSKNTLLRDTPSHLNDTNLQYHLESHMHPDLTAEYRTEQITEKDLRKWIEKVRLLDDKRVHLLAKHKEAAEAAYRVERGKVNVDKKLTSSTRFNSKQTQSASNPSSSNKTFVRLPLLTDDERQLLRDNHGCFKCREPFVQHSSSTCPTGFPDGATYKPLTTALIAAKKNKKSGTTVAAVDFSETVAVVMPSAALGNGSESGDECVAPFTTPHLTWDCLVDGPAVSSSVTVSALIDHGSPAVLINETLAIKLGLRHRTLPKPLPVSVALSGQQKQSFVLSHYVKLTCSSPDSLYKSRTVRAIIAPNLCTQLLLGGPFPAHNQIVIDHRLRTVIAKDVNYDLLNPPTPCAPAPSVVPNQLQVYSFKKDVVCELNHVLPEYKAIIDKECLPVNGIDLVGAIQAQIDKLTYQNDLTARDAAVKHEFIDRFPADICHEFQIQIIILSFQLSILSAHSQR